MNIHSLKFFGFTLVVLLFYYLLPRKKQNLLLLFASYFFYITIAWYFALVLMVMTVANYIIGRKIETPISSKKWLITGIILNLGVLFFFKYANFFVPEILSLISRIGISFQTRGLQILLPIGLSYYVLHGLSYLVDIYRKQIPASSNIVDFALYLAYFPKLTAGPIERAQTFLPKLAKQRVVDNELMSKSFSLLIVGLVRKVIIADTLLQAIPVKVFQNPLEFSFIQLIAWVGAYIFGLYNDFCGYTNIVRGISGFFGIELSRNFLNPFFSRSFSELWLRWHITLSFWIRDYIYFPISRALVRRNPKQSNPLNIILPPLSAMLASGLWHGPNSNFLVWGAVMAIYLIFERIFALWRPKGRAGKSSAWKEVLSMVMVPGLGSISAIFILMSIPTAFQFFQGVFTNTDWVLPNSRVFIVIIPALWIDYMQHRKKNELVFLSWSLVPRAIFLAMALLGIFLFSQSKIPTPFIYQGF
jgi:D-alanyl-lipoteichoic acid acyltransferase DltB (MBOAT superfamily)